MVTSLPLFLVIFDLYPQQQQNGLSSPQAAQRRRVPQMTLIDRLNGRKAAKDQIQPRRRLSKNQEDRLAFWILR
jgi:hypothetical protein